MLHLTVSLRSLMQTLGAGVARVCTRLAGLPDRRGSTALPRCPSRHQRLPALLLSPLLTVCQLESSSAPCPARCSAGSAEVSDEVRRRQSVGWEPISLFSLSLSLLLAVKRTDFLLNLKDFWAKLSVLILTTKALHQGWKKSSWEKCKLYNMMKTMWSFLSSVSHQSHRTTWLRASPPKDGDHACHFTSFYSKVHLWVSRHLKTPWCRRRRTGQGLEWEAIAKLQI